MPAREQPDLQGMVAQRPVPNLILPPVSLSIERATCLLQIKATTGFARYSWALGSSLRLRGMVRRGSLAMAGQEPPLRFILPLGLPSTMRVVSTSQTPATAVFVNWR